MRKLSSILPISARIAEVAGHDLSVDGLIGNVGPTRPYVHLFQNRGYSIPYRERKEPLWTRSPANHAITGRTD